MPHGKCLLMGRYKLVWHVRHSCEETGDQKSQNKQSAGRCARGAPSLALTLFECGRISRPTRAHREHMPPSPTPCSQTLPPHPMNALQKQRRASCSALDRRAFFAARVKRTPPLARARALSRSRVHSHRGADCMRFVFPSSPARAGAVTASMLASSRATETDLLSITARPFPRLHALQERARSLRRSAWCRRFASTARGSRRQEKWWSRWESSCRQPRAARCW